LEQRAGEDYDTYAHGINPQFIRVLRTIGFDRIWARGDGAYLYDAEGNRYLDALGGFGMFNHGRNNPRIRAALVEALELDTPGSARSSRTSGGAPSTTSTRSSASCGARTSRSSWSSPCRGRGSTCRRPATSRARRRSAAATGRSSASTRCRRDWAAQGSFSPSRPGASNLHSTTSSSCSP